MAFLRAEDYPVLAKIWVNDGDDDVFAVCAVCAHAEIEHAPICPETGEVDIYCSACGGSNPDNRIHEFKRDGDSNVRRVED